MIVHTSELTEKQMLNITFKYDFNKIQPVL